MAINAIFDDVIDQAIPVKPPVAVLKELAQELAKKTQGLLVGKVEQTLSSNGSFRIYFYINAPSLDNYIYLLIEIKHNLDFYPLWVMQSEQQPALNITNQDEFEDILKDIILQPQTKKVINSLLAQIKSSI